METRHFDTVIVGTGFAGLGMAISLKKAGRDSFVILEKAHEVGGTWRDNHYPGCACDVQSHLYSFSFEPNPHWTRMFAPQEEILEYLRHCARKYDLLPSIRFGTELQRAAFDESTGLWNVDTNKGSFTARVLVSGMGGLSRPAWPDIKGIETFKGKAFHSQQWDHDYDLEGKRVAVIGTGASAIQFVPAIAPKVGRLDLFQRTPPWILPKPDRSISNVEQWVFEKLPLTQKAWRAKIYAQLETRVMGFVVNPKIMNVVKYEALHHIKRSINDPALRKAVTPDYTLGCKRILMSDEYYPALTRDNVNVITTGIREVTENAVITADGLKHEVDVIIFGTGFQATEPIPPGMVYGRGGKELVESWADRGAEAYKGTTIAGFPNLFVLVGPNTGLGHSSMVYMIESQIDYVMKALDAMDDKGLQWIDVKPAVQTAFNERLQSKLDKAVWTAGGCKSWYIDPKTGKNVTLWPGFTWQFRRETARFDLADYAAAARSPKVEKAPAIVG